MEGNKTFIIAELSANHNQDLDLAVRTIRAMAEAGADAVKIQTYTPDSLVLDVDNEYFGPIKSGLWKGIKRYDLYKMASTPYEWHSKLKTVAEDCGLEFFSTPFDLEGVDFLETLGVKKYKIASFEINDIPLIRYVASKKKPMIVSTGAANLLTIPDMRRRFNCKVGISDHTLGTVVSVAGVTLGAEIVEKHFILSRELGGADAAFSMEPEEFRRMVDEIRIVEKALGQVNYDVSEASKKKRRSIYVKKDVKKGEIVSVNNIGIYRPGYGLEPKCWDQIIGMKFNCDAKRGEPLTFKMIE